MCAELNFGKWTDGSDGREAEGNASICQCSRLNHYNEKRCFKSDADRAGNSRDDREGEVKCQEKSRYFREDLENIMMN